MDNNLSVTMRLIDETKEAFNTAKANLTDFQDKAKATFSGLTDSIKEGGLAATAFLASTGLLAKSMIELGATMEQNKIAFTTFMGNADAAGKKLKELGDFAVKTPFDLPQVVEGARRLLAMGIEADKLIPTFKMLGDISAGVGTDKLPQLILAFGQVKAATRLTGAELRQFTEAGVPLLDELAKHFKTTAANVRDMISDGAVSFDDVSTSLEKTTQKGGRFFDLMDKQSHSLSGVLSNVRDNWVRFSTEVLGFTEEGDIRKGSIFYYLKQGAEKLLEVLNTVKPIAVKFFDDLLKNKDAVAMIAGAFAGLATAAALAFVLIAGKGILIASIFAAIGSAIGWVVNNWHQWGAVATTVILSIVALIGSVLVPMIVTTLTGAIMGFITVVTAFFSPIVLVIGLIIALVAGLFIAWQTNFLGIQQIVQNVILFFQTLPITIGNVINAIVLWFQQLPTRAGQFLMDLFFTQIPYWVGFAIGWLSVKIPEMWNNVVNWFWQGVLQVGLVMFSFFDTITKWITSAWTWISTEIPTWPGKIYNFLISLPQKVMTIFSDVKTKAIGKMEELWKGLTDIWEKIKGIFEGIINKANEAWQAATKGFNAGQNSANSEHRATGGAVASGSSYIVGERGPELFIPRVSGSIIPNYALSGGRSQVVNNYIQAEINTQVDLDYLAYKLGYMLRNT